MSPEIDEMMGSPSPLLRKEPVQVIRVRKMGENFSSHIWPTNDDRNTAKAFRSPEKRRHWRFLDYLDSLLSQEGCRAQRGGVVPLPKSCRNAALEPPRLLARLAGTPPDSGGEFRSLPIYSSICNAARRSWTAATDHEAW